MSALFPIVVITLMPMKFSKTKINVFQKSLSGGEEQMEKASSVLNYFLENSRNIT